MEMVEMQTEEPGAHEPKLPGRKFLTYSGWTRSPKGKQTTEDKIGNLTL